MTVWIKRVWRDVRLRGWRGKKERNEFERRKIDEQKIRLFNGEMEEKAFVSKKYVWVCYDHLFFRATVTHTTNTPTDEHLPDRSSVAPHSLTALQP